MMPTNDVRVMSYPTICRENLTNVLVMIDGQRAECDARRAELDAQREIVVQTIAGFDKLVADAQAHLFQPKAPRATRKRGAQSGLERTKVLLQNTPDGLTVDMIAEKLGLMKNHARNIISHLHNVEMTVKANGKVDGKTVWVWVG